MTTTTKSTDAALKAAKSLAIDYESVGRKSFGFEAETAMIAEHLDAHFPGYDQIKAERDQMKVALETLIVQVRETCKTRKFSDGPLAEQCDSARAALQAAKVA